MKASAKRRRSKAQILEEKMREQNKEAEYRQRMAQMEQMQHQWNEMVSNLNHANQIQAEVEELFDNGLIKKAASGKYVVVENARERENIRQQSEAKKKEARRHAQNFD